MSTNEIDAAVAAFIQAARRHHEFTEVGDRHRINAEADKINNAYRALRDYGAEGKRALLALLESKDLAVASMAAAYCMHFAPLPSKAALTRAKKDKGILGLKAKYALKRFDDGSWSAKPT